MITIKDGQYVIEVPERGIIQPFDPVTQQPWVSEAAAQAWLDETTTAMDAAQASSLAAHAAAHATLLASTMHLEVTTDHDVIAAGATATITATLKNALGQTVPLNQFFAVPVDRNEVLGDRIKGVTLVNGTATVTMTFPTSGHYRITEQGINSRLEGQHISLPTPLEITVFE